MSIILFLIEVYIAQIIIKHLKPFNLTRNNFVLSTLQAGSFHNPIQGLTVYIDKVSKNGTVQNILIHDIKIKVENTILAKEGILTNFENKANIIVFNGARYLYNNKVKKLQY